MQKLEKRFVPIILASARVQSKSPIFHHYSVRCNSSENDSLLFLFCQAQTSCAATLISIAERRAVVQAFFPRFFQDMGRALGIAGRDSRDRIRLAAITAVGLLLS